MISFKVKGEQLTIYEQFMSQYYEWVYQLRWFIMGLLMLLYN